MKRNLVSLILGIAATGQADLIENFEAYSTGPTPNPWITAGINADSQIVDMGDSNQVLRMVGGPGGSKLLNMGRTVLDLDTQNQIHDGRTGIISFRIMAAASSTDITIGLSHVATPTSRNYDFAASITFEDGWIRGWDGSDKVFFLRFATNQWYDIELRLDSQANTYDVQIDDVPVYNGAPFLANSDSSDLVSIKIMSDKSANPGDYAFIDDIHVIPEPAVIGLISMAGIMLVATRRWSK